MFNAKPPKVTALAVATSLVLYVPVAVPVRATVSPVYALPSVEVPVPAISVAANVAGVSTVAVVVAS